MNPNTLRWLSRRFVRNEQVSFYSRISPGATGNWSTGSPYTLYRANREEEKRQTTDPMLKKGSLTWFLAQTDLDNAGAPNPKIDDRIVDSSGQAWTIKELSSEEMNSVWICTCIKELPVNKAIN